MKNKNYPKKIGLIRFPVRIASISQLKDMVNSIDPHCDKLKIRSGNEKFKFAHFHEKIEKTIIIRPISFELVIHVLNIADGLILLSEDKTEGAPRVLQESLAMGTPIIASNVCGIKEKFSDIRGAILIDRDSFTEFKDAIDTIGNKEMIVNRDKVREKFDMISNYEKYGEIYKNILLKESDSNV